MEEPQQDAGLEWFVLSYESKGDQPIVFFDTAKDEGLCAPRR